MSRDIEMDEAIERLKTPESLEQYASNIEGHAPEHAKKARVRAVRLRAEAHGATTAVEREALEAIYAYERAKSHLRGKTIRASRTWPMVERKGIIAAVEAAVDRPSETLGYRVLAGLGMQDMAFEAVILRHPQVFSSKAVAAARARIEARAKSDDTTARTGGEGPRGQDNDV